MRRWQAGDSIECGLLRLLLLEAALVACKVWSRTRSALLQMIYGLHGEPTRLHLLIALLEASGVPSGLHHHGLLLLLPSGLLRHHALLRLLTSPSRHETGLSGLEGIEQPFVSRHRCEGTSLPVCLAHHRRHCLIGIMCTESVSGGSREAAGPRLHRLHRPRRSVGLPNELRNTVETSSGFIRGDAGIGWPKAVNLLEERLGGVGRGRGRGPNRWLWRGGRSGRSWRSGLRRAGLDSPRIVIEAADEGLRLLSRWR